MADFVLVCPKRVLLVLKFVRLRVRSAVEGLLIFELGFAEKCRKKDWEWQKSVRFRSFLLFQVAFRHCLREYQGSQG
jgi:hypothetical protein